MRRGIGLLLGFIWMAACGGYWQEPPTPQAQWVPTMSEPSTARAGTRDQKVPRQKVERSVGDRLEELQSLRARGLISEEELKQRRMEILREL